MKAILFSENLQEGNGTGGGKERKERDVKEFLLRSRGRMAAAEKALKPVKTHLKHPCTECRAGQQEGHC